MNKGSWRFGAWIVVLALSACGAPKYTIDDGRKVNEELLRNIRTYGAAETALRPAIQRSAQLKDPGCDKQWELPISVASSAAYEENDRVAWVRGLGVDERLTVIAAVPGSGFAPGDKLEAIDGYSRRDAAKMSAYLTEKRDDGKPFPVTLAGGRTVPLQPFQVCRGHVFLAVPNAPKLQDYHWLMSVHPLETVQEPPTEDEALWMVLWTQGLSEEGGARMKLYHYGTKIAGKVYSLATLVSGVKGVAMAAETAVKAAQTAAANAISDALRKKLMDEAAEIARNQVRDQLSVVVRHVSQQQAMTTMEIAAANRGALSGVAWIAGTTFDQADAWAFQRMIALNADPLAAFTLHQKLIDLSLPANAFVFDKERLAAVSRLAEAQGKGEDAVAILNGVRPDTLQLNVAAMPLASAGDSLGIFGADAEAAPRPQIFGFVDALLDMPLESASTN
ncbi:hypothetical protein [Noviherbaspirillum pedocola]|uniref:Uncharacterized protein n=1 Tax=Noviherbaspirillum pedocola TaxID=2801341 RepID=A0A934SY61_9BURK|nr:hypothetical protein [Noviherbaspirillum pedocola]MBK4737718.1 hypothetical protein [Noviherbaspirillum pedocola]